MLKMSRTNDVGKVLIDLCLVQFLGDVPMHLILSSEVGGAGISK